jgi:pilus assembly protein TadC
MRFMKLSEQEMRWLRRWEKNERLWLPVTRWVCLGMGVLSLVMAILIFRMLETPANVAIASFIVPIALCFFLNAFWCFSLAMVKWRGDIKLRLLLRLIREHENKDAP